MRWSFAKYVACGNDFILFDNRQSLFPLSRSSLIPYLCHRQRGIGADGVLLLESSTLADFRMRIFNSDGSEAEMCGNGIRCFVKWLADIGFQGPVYRIETKERILTALQSDDMVSIEMGGPTDVQWDISLSYENQSLHVHHLNTGVPHTVLFVKDIDHFNLLELGSYLRDHPFWMPNGTNVTIAQQISPGEFKVRTYERGVEGETLSCGTGAAAAALAAAYQNRLLSPLTVRTRSGEELRVGFLEQRHRFTQVTLTGPASCTFRGEIDLPENEEIDYSGQFNNFSQNLGIKLT